MDYCTCGAQAVGRCVAGGEFFCGWERRTYPPSIRDLLADAGEQPPAQWYGQLCPSCHRGAIEAALPTVAAHLFRVEAGSIERIVHRLASRRFWADLENHNRTLGVDIVTAVAGERPAWLFNSLPRTLAALYATMARSRSPAPPFLQVENEEVRHTPTLFNRHKTTTTVTQLGELRAWPFAYSTDRGFSRLVYVGAGGILMEADLAGRIRNGTMTMRGVPRDVRKYLNELNRKLVEPPHEGHFDDDAVDVLAAAVSRLL
ncbi:hypothetical protein [Streptomyces erythrochromogenes]|uniref:hypothetical protein n=1 Tax=Streptomyces erythrochromogenes TaxID=285574 RepID=UPI0036FD1EDF